MPFFISQELIDDIEKAIYEVCKRKKTGEWATRSEIVASLLADPVPHASASQKAHRVGQDIESYAGNQVDHYSQAVTMGLETPFLREGRGKHWAYSTPQLQMDARERLLEVLSGLWRAPRDG